MVFLVLIAAVAGWGLGLFASGNILLPLFWAWPKARRLSREGKLDRPIPAVRILLPPVLWSIALAVSVLLVTSMFPSLDYSFAIGLIVGFGQTARLLTSPDQHMEADFVATYGGYFKGKKEVDAVIRIVSNLFEKALLSKGDVPNVLRWTLPDSRFRYLMFCLSTVHAVCAHRMNDPNSVLQQCVFNLAYNAATYKGPDPFFEARPDIQKTVDDGARLLRNFLDRWSKWIDATRADPTNARAGTMLVSSMLQTTESLAPMSEGDGHLTPLACWFEDYIPVIDEAFVKLSS
jgi:hypothetical protein